MSYTYSRHKHVFFTALSFVLIFLWSQNYLIKHELEHSSTVTEVVELCQLCALAQQNKDSIHITALPTTLNSSHALLLLVILPIAIVVTRSYLLPQTRAPPILLR